MRSTTAAAAAMSTAGRPRTPLSSAAVRSPRSSCCGAVRRDRRQGERDVVQGLGEHAAEADHGDRAEPGVAVDPHDQLDAVRRVGHRLDRVGRRRRAGRASPGRRRPGRPGPAAPARTPPASDLCRSRSAFRTYGPGNASAAASSWASSVISRRCGERHPGGAEQGRGRRGTRRRDRRRAAGGSGATPGGPPASAPVIGRQRRWPRPRWRRRPVCPASTQRPAAGSVAGTSTARRGAWRARRLPGDLVCRLRLTGGERAPAAEVPRRPPGRPGRR